MKWYIETCRLTHHKQVMALHQYARTVITLRIYIQHQEHNRRKKTNMYVEKVLCTAYICHEIRLTDYTVIKQNN